MYLITIIVVVVDGSNQIIVEWDYLPIMSRRSLGMGAM